MRSCSDAFLPISSMHYSQSVAASDEHGGVRSPRRSRVVRRSGTRGMCWLEPLVEVVVGSERYAYGPVTERDIPGLFAADFLHDGAHALRLGRVDDIPYFASQQRLTFERVGVIEPTSLTDYLKYGGYEGLLSALKMEPRE